MLLPEFEIVTESEIRGNDSSESEDELPDGEDESNLKTEQLKEENKYGHDDALDVAELEAMANRETDKQFSRFKKIVKEEPEQVTFYHSRNMQFFIN